jgi:hypothetical protein
MNWVNSMSWRYRIWFVSCVTACVIACAIACAIACMSWQVYCTNLERKNLGWKCRKEKSRKKRQTQCNGRSYIDDGGSLSWGWGWIVSMHVSMIIISMLLNDCMDCILLFQKVLCQKRRIKSWPFLVESSQLKYTLRIMF